MLTRSFKTIYSIFKKSPHPEKTCLKENWSCAQANGILLADGFLLVDVPSSVGNFISLAHLHTNEILGTVYWNALRCVVSI